MSRGAQTLRVAMVALGLAMAAGANPATAASQMFKCVVDKRTVYQQQACPANAEPPSAPASAPPTGAAPPGASHAGSAAQRGTVRPASRAASYVPATPR